MHSWCFNSDGTLFYFVTRRPEDDKNLYSYDMASGDIDCVASLGEYIDGNINMMGRDVLLATYTRRGAGSTMPNDYRVTLFRMVPRGTKFKAERIVVKPNTYQYGNPIYHAKTNQLILADKNSLARVDMNTGALRVFHHIVGPDNILFYCQVNPNKELVYLITTDHPDQMHVIDFNGSLIRTISFREVYPGYSK